MAPRPMNQAAIERLISERVTAVVEAERERQVATMGLEAANQIGWTEMRRLMTKEFYPVEEVQRMEHEL
ncbi:hypothetical protein Tco_0624025 [Tanacetum coccineum]|uniref:Uncharacterized protein n=1 Tax=Tanacetum coccineum TaxID=301880 RepID=A0ABQ4WCW9_9ASTR